jgi:hypothetical protein
MTPTAYLLALAALMAVAAAVGTAWGVARTAKKTKTEEMYAAENEIMGKINHRLENEVTRLQSKVDTQEVALSSLREAVTQRAEVSRLMEELHKEERHRREEHEAVIVLLKDILGQLKNARGGAPREIGR